MLDGCISAPALSRHCPPSRPEEEHERHELKGEPDRPNGNAQLVPGRIPVRGEDRAHDDSHPSHQGKLLRPSRDPRAGCLLEPRDPPPSSGQTARSTTVPPPTPPRQALRGRQKPARSTTWTRLSRSGPWPQRTPLPPAAPTPTRPTPHRRC